MKSGFKEPMNDKLKIISVDEYLGYPSEGKLTYTGVITNFQEALLLQMPKDSGGTVVSTAESFLYGRVLVSFKSSLGTGVVSSFILFSNVHDEVDMEFMGFDGTLESNYYYRGQLDYTHKKTHNVPNIDRVWHKYEIDWQEDETNWYIDGNVVRTLKRKDTWDEGLQEFKYMRTPCRVQLSIWPAGAKSQPPGTRDWAGGEINWNSEIMKKTGYYYAFAKDLEVHPSDENPDHNAFKYVLNGGEAIVEYTNDKTWLGSMEASGLDPQNSGSLPSLSTSESSSSSLSLSESKSSSSSLSLSKSKSSSSSLSLSKSKSSSSRTTTGKINPATGNVTINAFLATSSTSSSSADVWQQGTTDSTTRHAGASRVEGFVGFLSLMAGLLLWT